MAKPTSGPVRLKRISHVALGAADLSRQAEFYRDTWGLEAIQEAPGQLFLRANGRHHHVLELASGTSGLAHVAFEVADDGELERAVDVLGERGIAPEVTPTRGLEPGIGRLLRFRDPEGNPIELVSAVEDVIGDYGQREVKPNSLNHVVLFAGDVARQRRFYEDVFGMRVSDTIGGLMVFLRCNANHHSLGLIGVPGWGLQHAAFDVPDREALARGLFYLGDRGVKRVHGPGRHGPGNMLFTYYQDPEHNVVEYCTEIQRVDEGVHRPRSWDSVTAQNLWRTNERVGPPPGFGWATRLLPLVSRVSRRHARSRV